jgi:hypothetical protein
MEKKKRKMVAMHRMVPAMFAAIVFGIPLGVSAHFAAPANVSINYRCNEFQGARKDLCMRNQLRVIRCSGLKGIYKRECMEKNEPFRGDGRLQRFSR